MGLQRGVYLKRVPLSSTPPQLNTSVPHKRAIPFQPRKSLSSTLKPLRQRKALYKRVLQFFSEGCVELRGFWCETEGVELRSFRCGTEGVLVLN